MHPLEGFVLIIGVNAVLLLAGYWFTFRLLSLNATERLAAALIAGLAVLLLMVSIINFFQPLQGVWAWLCLLPCGFTLADARSRGSLASDLALLWRTSPRRLCICITGMVAFLGLLLWPLLHTPNLIFYDGSANHDSFFWIITAEYLKTHTYMVTPPPDALHPLHNVARVVTGLLPDWGRMGSEGLLALISALMGLTTVKIFLYATAALFPPWLAGVYLVIKTFIADKLDDFSVLVLVLLQPIFLFFHSNANLPNLIGILTGTLLIVAVARAVASATRPIEGLAWRGLAALAVHGTLCSYPEVLPFVLLPAGLLIGRALWHRQPAPAFATMASLALGFALNWVSTTRGLNGFLNSFFSARADSQWVNIFHSLSWPEIAPALATLITAAGSWIGPCLGGALSIFIILLLGLLLRRARDPWGLAFALAGSALLLIYTASTDFLYGLQKSIQFGGVAVAALFPIGGVVVLRHELTATACRSFQRHAVRGCIATCVIYAGFALGLGAFKHPYRHARLKPFVQENFALRHNPLSVLHGGRILVVGESFPMAFFHGMWAAYSLPDAKLVFSASDRFPGGYLAPYDKVYHPGQPPPDAVYVSREWADSIDANLPRLIDGQTFTLLHDTNQVLHRQGLDPMEGVPRFAAKDLQLTIRPHADSWLHLAFAPIDLPVPMATVVASRQGQGIKSWSQTRQGAPPWRIAVPLTAGKNNHISIRFTADRLADESYPLEIQTLTISNQP